MGAIFMLIAAGFAIFKIRFNAVLTGFFLGIELIALLIVTVLGFSHPRHFSAFVHPAIGTGHGLLIGVAFSGVLAVTAVAIFSYNGYASAVNFAEETAGTGRNIARAILWSLVITVAAELIPLTATIVGSPSLAKLSQSVIPMQYFIEGNSNSALYDVLSLGIVLAILNATIAIILSYARILYSAARDKAFPGPVSGWMAQIHPRFRSPSGTCSPSRRRCC